MAEVERRDGSVLLQTLDTLTDEQIHATVIIRRTDR